MHAGPSRAEPERPFPSPREHPHRLMQPPMALNPTFKDKRGRAPGGTGGGALRGHGPGAGRDPGIRTRGRGCDVPREALPGRLEKGPELWLSLYPVESRRTCLQTAVPTSQPARPRGRSKGTRGHSQHRLQPPGVWFIVAS